AAYKACELVRWLTQQRASVVVAMTAAATEFVTPLTFQALSGNPVVRGLWGDQRPGFALPPEAAEKVGGRIEHVDVAEAADCLVIAPATADFMARLVHGEAPDALTAIALACPAPLIVCPAMDLEMWRQPATQSNVKALRARGAILVGPESGPLASGLSGPGRLASLEAIGEAITRAVARRTSMKGLRVLIGAGRTEEPIDPVRVLTNRSSGRMGFALAEAALQRGASVTLVAGPTSVEPPHGARIAPVTTAAEMEREMRRHAPKADLVIMAAAVADYRPARAASEKLKRGEGARTIELVPNPDILAGIAARRPRGQVVVGFALETTRGLANARAKLLSKGLDLIVLNTPRAGIGSETNQVTLVERTHKRALPVLPKREVAEHILERVLELRGASSTPGRTVSRRGATASRPLDRATPKRGARNRTAARRGTR
ncbi:MAG TPA: bifunctional phosphopantothenoylcysteine decarboxylase/phosphopantothenate--cysteine ligase CoaBC, partial [Candidatus Udaeobacter sp.]|nr:bifunctional phosphopantothenoylcysteine decarboxylase/phosphopantothenate--cysteine ligase CoaBC [Candidatus Udaeobacter sp.]